MKILISTSCRNTPINAPSGHLFVYDVIKNKIITESEIIEPPYRQLDLNPRGGFRGLKGISIESDKVVIANASTIFVFDKDWKQIHTIYHPSCAGIHDLVLLNNKIWVTSSRNDLVFCFDLQGNIINVLDIRENFTLGSDTKPFLTQKQIHDGTINFRDPRTHDHFVTDLLHINSLAFFDSESFLLSIGLVRKIDHKLLHRINNKFKNQIHTNLIDDINQNLKKLIKRTSKNETINTKTESISALLLYNQGRGFSQRLTLENCRVPSHSVRVLRDSSAIYLNSTTGEIIHFDPTGSGVYSSMKIGNRFLRGAKELPDSTIMVGDNNYIIRYDIKTHKILSRKMLVGDSNEAIFDLNILPDSFSLPPESFIKI